MCRLLKPADARGSAGCRATAPSGAPRWRIRTPRVAAQHLLPHLPSFPPPERDYVHALSIHLEVDLAKFANINALPRRQNAVAEQEQVPRTAPEKLAG